MADLGILSGFNANDFEDTFSPLPEGDYEVEIIDSVLVENSKQTGQFLKLTLKVLSGDGKGRQLFDNFNLVHVNPKAVEIAQSQFAALCRAVGVLSPADTSELHNIPIVATLSIDGDWNRIRRYKSITNVTTQNEDNLAGKIKNAPAKKGRVRKPKAEAPPTEEEFEDDLPF